MRATYLSAASCATFAGRIPAQSPAHPHYQPRIHESRGKYNHRVFRKWVRHRCYGGHAATTIVMVTISRRQQRICLSNLNWRVEFNLTRLWDWRELEPSGVRTYLRALSPLIKPVDPGTFRGVADSLQDGCLSCICSSNNQNSELDIRDSEPLILLGSHGTKVL